MPSNVGYIYYGGEVFEVTFRKVSNINSLMYCDRIKGVENKGNCYLMFNAEIYSTPESCWIGALKDKIGKERDMEECIEGN